MTTYKTRMVQKTHTRGGVKIRGGKYIPLIFAKITCRCAECLGELKDLTNGVGCASDDSHRGIITKKEADQIRRQQESDLEEVTNVYSVRDGKIVTGDAPEKG